MANRKVYCTFPKEMIKEPLLYNLGKNFNVIPNIRGASITDEVGLVYLELEGDEAEIEERHRAVLAEQDVARVEVGVNEAVLEHHLQDRAAAPLGELGAAVADLLGLGALHAADELHREHALRAERVEEVGHVHLLLAPEVLREAAVVRGLFLEVELVLERSPEHVDRARQREQVEIGMCVEEPRARSKVKEILETYMLDNAKARELNADGTYSRVPVPNGEPVINVQERFLALARGESVE